MSNPCINGQCIEENAEFSCLCDEGYGGKFKWLKKKKIKTLVGDFWDGKLAVDWKLYDIFSK